MSSPRVSVIIPCYNKAQFVGEAIESVLTQTIGPPEIIAIDDGSTDGTWEVLQSFADRVLCVRQENRGTAAARQRGLEMAHGDIVGFLDHDDRWLATKLERQLPMFGDPSVAIVTGPYYVIDEKGDRQRVGGHPRADAFDVHQWKVENHIGTVNTLFRRDAALQVGGMDTRIRGCDDWDLWIRIAAHYRTALLDEPLAEYRSYGGQMSRDGLLMYRNRMRVLRKYRRLHPRCDECERGFREGVTRARAKLRLYATQQCAAAFVAYERGDYATAWAGYRSAIGAWPGLLWDPRLLRVILSLAKRSVTGYNRPR